MTSPVRVEKRTSAAKAVKRSPFYGTAEAVPFVGQSLPQPHRVSERFMGWPNWPTEKPNLDKCEFLPVTVPQIGSVMGIIRPLPAILGSRRSLADPMKHPIDCHLLAGLQIDLGRAIAIEHPILDRVIAT